MITDLKSQYLVNKQSIAADPATSEASRGRNQQSRAFIIHMWQGCTTLDNDGHTPRRT
jgi:hypothetical protein